MADYENNIFYRPCDGGTGDVIPIYHDGKFYIFYLHSTRVTWVYTTTTDFIHYTDIVQLKPFGGTGDLIYKDGQWHLFASWRRPGVETLRHFAGPDFEHLEDLHMDVVADGDVYDMQDFRDPRVYFDESVGKYRILLANMTRLKNDYYRGATVVSLLSDDLYHWELDEPFLRNGYFHGPMECPDWFKMGDWYYLIYSDGSFGKQTYYAKSKNPTGPWEIPDHDDIDTTFNYAAKTAFDGKNRYIFGWAGDRLKKQIALNENENIFDPDFALIRYAGNMIVHKLMQKENGDLYFAPVDSHLAVFDKTVENSFRPMFGNWEYGDNFAKSNSPYDHSAIIMQQLPKSYKLTFKLKMDAKQAGFALNTHPEFVYRGYNFAFERQYRRIRQISNAICAEGGFYFPFASELEQPISFEPGKVYDITILADGEIAVIYVDGECAMTTRMKDAGNGGSLGLFCYAGHAEFTDIEMKTR